ncbi:MAG: amidohydrolase family protein [Candidatus Dormibacteria bacterium]
MAALQSHPRVDSDVSSWVTRLGIPGIFDIHVHFMPDAAQRAVWRHFDALGGWEIRYRTDEATRLTTLQELGVLRHTALAYAHKPDMAAWLNEYTLGLAERDNRTISTFTFYPEPSAGDYVRVALEQGGRVAKVHLQVGKFDPADPLLVSVWDRLESAGTVVVIHAGAVADGSGGEAWCGMAPVRRLLLARPGLKLVLAHLGAPDYADAVALAEEFPQLLMDTAMVLVEGTGFSYPPDLMAWLQASPRRILFGSDFPSFPHDYAAQLRGLAATGFGEAWLRRVLWHNAAELLPG